MLIKYISLHTVNDKHLMRSILLREQFVENITHLPLLWITF
jgi:hypothetical protein